MVTIRTAQRIFHHCYTRFQNVFPIHQKKKKIYEVMISSIIPQCIYISKHYTIAHTYAQLQLIQKKLLNKLKFGAVIVEPRAQPPLAVLAFHRSPTLNPAPCQGARWSSWLQSGPTPPAAITWNWKNSLGLSLTFFCLSNQYIFLPNKFKHKTPIFYQKKM